MLQENPQIICKQSFLSGHHKGLLKMLLPAQNCLTLTLTKEKLTIKLMWPFDYFKRNELFGFDLFDSEVDVNTDEVNKVVLKKFVISPGSHIHYNKNGQEKVYILYPWFWQFINIKSGFEKAGIDVKS